MVFVTVLAGVVPATIAATEHTVAVEYDFEDEALGDRLTDYGDRIEFAGGGVVVATAPQSGTAGGQIVSGPTEDAAIVITFEDPQRRVDFHVRGAGQVPSNPPDVTLPVPRPEFDPGVSPAPSVPSGGVPEAEADPSEIPGSTGSPVIDSQPIPDFGPILTPIPIPEFGPILTPRPPGGEIVIPQEYGASVKVVAYDADGNEVAAFSGDSPLHQWHAVTLTASGSDRIVRVETHAVGNEVFCQANTDCSFAVDTQLDVLAFEAHGPTARIGVEPARTAVDSVTRFDASGTETTGRIESYEWDFGDGTTSDDRRPEHRFGTPGSKVVTLVVTDEFGLRSTTTADVEVVRGPTVRFDYGPELPSEGDTVRFDASDTESDGTIVAYEWDFGDGTTADRETVSHVYDEAGTYTVSLRVTDSNGQEASDSEQITVNALPGGAVDTTANADEARPGERITFEAVDVTDESTSSLRYAWDFGDGRQATGARVTHAYDDPGTYEVTLTITDNRGVSRTITDELAVLASPTAALSVAGGGNVDVGEEVSFDASVSGDSDGVLVEYRWDFGDGSEPVVTTAPSTAHTYDEAGAYTATVTVVDDDGLSDTTQVTVQAAPGLPLTQVAVALVGLVAALVVGVVAYRRYTTAEKTPTPPTPPTPPSERDVWQDIVIESIEERRNSKRLTLRNTSDEPYDLSGAALLDDDGERFTFRDGLVLEPGEREVLPVDTSMSLTPGTLVLLQTRDEEFELPWQEFLGGRGSGG